MATDKRYKKRKKKGGIIGKIIAVIVICIAGGIFAKIGLPIILNEKKSINPQQFEPNLSADKEHNNSESFNDRSEEELLIESQESVSSEAEKEMKSSEEIEKECDSWIEAKLEGMELDEKAAQLFFVSVDTLSQVENTTIAEDAFKERFSAYPVGGIALLNGNIVNPEQLKSLTQTIGELSNERIGLNPFVGVAEEGGSVLQIANKPEFGLNDVGKMNDIGAGDEPEAAYKVGDYIGSYLSEYGINVDFAPVADVIYNSSNSVVDGRAFGQDPNLVSEMVSKEVEGLQKSNVSAVLKHFPGHGTTEGDPSEGDAVSQRTLTELETTDYAPFRKGIEAGADFVMVGHIIMKNVSQEEVPASVSSYFMTDILKNEWGYDGIIITDDISMAAISNRFSPADAAVAAINAGADMIYTTSDFDEAYQGIVDGVNQGVISSDRIDESIRRILRIKYMKQFNG